MRCKHDGIFRPNDGKLNYGSGGIRTHAIEMTDAENQGLRPLGHATCTKLPVKWFTAV